MRDMIKVVLLLIVVVVALMVASLLLATRPQDPTLLAKFLEQRVMLESVRSEISQIRKGMAVQGREAQNPVPVTDPAAPYCEWTKIPGTTLGGQMPRKWVTCAKEQGTCHCTGLVRFGKSPEFVYLNSSGAVTCNTETFQRDPRIGVFKGCDCQGEQETPTSLAAAQQRCETLGTSVCKGVTCEDASFNECTPRDGSAYLTPSSATSWVWECSPAKPLSGGGSRGPSHVNSQPTIFISMAAFRDRDAHYTLSDLFRKAKYPQRVFVGVVCQVHPGDMPCIPESWKNCSLEHGYCPSDQVRQRVFAASMAEGPTHARSIAASMYRDEDYFFMMDAHNRFVTHWDTRIVDMHRKCPSPRCVLSHYPQGVNNSDPDHPFPLGTTPGTSLDTFGATSYLCGGEYHDNAIIKNQRAMTVPIADEPRPQPYSGAGLLFGPGRMIIEVPFDPYLSFIWDGEEFLYNARLWTWGYDLFSPNDNVLFHHYYRENQPRIWSEKSWSTGKGQATQQASYRRLQYILKATKKGSDEYMVPRDTREEAVIRGLPKYGLGWRRSIDDFWKFARADIRNRAGDPKMESHAGFFCKRYSQDLGPYVVPPP